MADVLTIDDSPTVRMDPNQAIEGGGHSTSPCDSLAAARRELAANTFGLINLDVLLPDGDGVELLRQIRSLPRTASLRVMLLSSEAEVHDRIRGLSTGADDYVGKPPDHINGSSCRRRRV